MNQLTGQTPTLLDQAACWAAVEERDRLFEGLFVYAVRSTGIYCKPTCPSRRPRRDQVTFYTTCAEAEAAGYRACKRCHPQATLGAPAGASLSPLSQTDVIEKAMQVIDANVDEPLPLEALSQELHISPSHLHRLFKSATGLTPRQYAAGQRLEKFKAQVRGGQAVTEALYEAGYSSSSRLYEGASARLGMTPASYRRGGQGMDIRYTIVDTYLGRMLVAATAQGICSVCFGEEDARLETILGDEYPAASLSRDDASFKTWVDALLRHLEGAQPRLALPLDLQATAFQLRVWEELRKIPYGETRSYAEVARAMGEPKAVRAVANACASNPAAIVTPCHRVVRSDGQPGGYRWGAPRKQALLARERSERDPGRAPGSKEQA